MLKCECGKEFENYRQLNGHKSSHNRGPSFSVGRKKTPVFNCKMCGIECEASHSKKNVFCGSKCCGDFTKQQNDELISAGLKPANRRYIVDTCGEKCALCGQGPEWNGLKLTLQLDHIDGDSDHNSASNLRLLCPNCHTQTETYGRKGGSKVRKPTKRNKYLRQYQTPDSALLA